MKQHVVAFVPVRGGSKSIPLKNIKNLCGKPLVWWVLEALERTKEIDEVIVSTDSAKISEVVSSFGFSKVDIFRRNPRTATDLASSESAVLECIRHFRFRAQTVFVLAQATSPLTESIHFSEGIRLFLRGDYDSVVTCVRMKRFFWSEDGQSLNYDYRKRPRRQEFSGTLMENGAFYVSSVGAIRKSGNRLSGRIGVYEMPEWTSAEIDEPSDWVYLEHMLHAHRDVNLNPIPIRLVVSDVDGVLTDAGMYYSESGDELKKFNTKDGMAFQLLHERGVYTGILTSEKTEIVKRRAKKLRIDYLVQGVAGKDKVKALHNVCSKAGISMSDVVYIGDDVNCLPVLKAVGHPFCPFDAAPAVCQCPGITRLSRCGGEAVFRELVDRLLLNLNPR